jgi:quinol monooxygenase YgiN
MSDTTTVVVVVTLKMKAGMEDEARAMLHAAVAPTLAEPGCLAYDLHQSNSDPTEFLFYERWANRAALEAHAASTAEHRLKLREHLGAMLAGAPSLTTWHKV